MAPPGIGSTKTKNAPVPTSGCVQREMTQGPTLRFSMMGNGGPLCAFAVVGKISQSTDRNQTANIPSKWHFNVMFMVTAALTLERRHPFISVARISMGWNISHIDAIQRTMPNVAHGMNARIGLW